MFQVNIGFRVQSRAGFGKEEGESGVVEGEIRRMRLKLDGFVYNPKFGYKVELGFSARDIGTVVVGNSGNVILRRSTSFINQHLISQLVLDRLNYLEITNV